MPFYFLYVGKRELLLEESFMVSVPACRVSSRVMVGFAEALSPNTPNHDRVGYTLVSTNKRLIVGTSLAGVGGGGGGGGVR